MRANPFLSRVLGLLLAVSFVSPGRTGTGFSPESNSGQMGWDFENPPPRGLPSGLEVVRGSWEIRELSDAPAGPRVLVQAARNRGATFNLVVFAQPRLENLDLSVQLKALEGREDQGGGLVWRYRDPDNYYVARANPLESNFRVYKVVEGRRLMLHSASLVIAAGWHSLRITMRGNQIECFFDGRSYLSVSDDTFSQAGYIGLWTKADAITAFDDLRVEPLTNTPTRRTP